MRFRLTYHKGKYNKNLENWNRYDQTKQLSLLEGRGQSPERNKIEEPVKRYNRVGSIQKTVNLKNG